MILTGLQVSAVIIKISTEFLNKLKLNYNMMQLSPC